MVATLLERQNGVKMTMREAKEATEFEDPLTSLEAILVRYGLKSELPCRVLELPRMDREEGSIFRRKVENMTLVLDIVPIVLEREQNINSAAPEIDTRVIWDLLLYICYTDFEDSELISQNVL